MLHTARHVTLRRAPDLPQVSRPGNKQASVVRIGTEGDLPASNTSCAFCIILHHFTHHEKRWKTSNNHHRFVETWHDWNIFFYIVKYWNTHEIHRHNEIWKMMWNVTMTWIRPRRQVKAWAVPRYAEQMQMQSRCRADAEHRDTLRSRAEDRLHLGPRTYTGQSGLPKGTGTKLSQLCCQDWL